MDPEGGETTKISVTCLTSEAAKIQRYNFLNEDPECKYAYPSYAFVPSFAAKNGDCVQVGITSWMRYEVLSTNGKFEETTNSWELPDHGQPKSKEEAYSTEAAKNDTADGAASCMMEDVEVYADPDCKQKVDM